MPPRPKKYAISFPVTIWYMPESGEICIARPTDRDFFTTIHPDPDSLHGHPHLYRQLARALRQGGAPHPKLLPRVN